MEITVDTENGEVTITITDYSQSIREITREELRNKERRNDFRDRSR